MNPGNRLHQPAVAVAQAAAIHVLHVADVRVAVASDGDRLLAAQDAGHAVHPQLLVADVLVDELVDPGQELQGFVDGGDGRRDEFEQRLGVVRGDVWMRQR